MMFNVKAYLFFAVCALGALFAAATSDGSDEDAVAAVGHDVVRDQLDASQLRNLTQHVVQARDDAPPSWDSKRTMVIGIGNNGQNVGRKDKLSISAAVKQTIDDLCPMGQTGFRLCDTENGWTYDQVPIKDQKGNLVRDGSYKIKIGSNHWGVAGAREILRDAMVTTISNVVNDNCWKPGFNGGDSQVELCKAPDKTMVRIDYVGWLVVFITADAKKMAYHNDMRICKQEGWATGETQTKVENEIKREIKEKKWHEPLKLKSADDLSVVTDCFTGTPPAGQGDGWCRTLFEYKKC
ncbi:hypothetical protein P171DRAFT_438544 [Karstenula rhodostoma CBS 690.94]|uniref:Ecp2 effector protein domain-containing protein n=1 Tax=Karstenula rhodostoma CBS 690.94 TaxID=1392251 RepID=A0A9P4PZS1_9PLEO|nr:hypothetical protein P171DRAFT_438544 [Karstenula rhodostoma CBS 690.94]